MDIEIEEGVTTTRRMTILDANQQPIDLTGKVASIRWRGVTAGTSEGEAPAVADVNTQQVVATLDATYYALDERGLDVNGQPVARLPAGDYHVRVILDDGLGTITRHPDGPPLLMRVHPRT